MMSKKNLPEVKRESKVYHDPAKQKLLDQLMAADIPRPPKTKKK